MAARPVPVGVLASSVTVVVNLSYSIKDDSMSSVRTSRLLAGGLVAAGIALASAAGFAQVPAPAEQPGAQKGYAAPRTPWGDPDLQGIWPGIELVGVPMARPANFGTRNWLTDEEFTQRLANAEKQALQDSAEFDLEEAAATPGGDVGGPVSPPPHWLERGTPQRVASLIIDPPDGRQPALTADAQQRTQAQQAARKQSGRGPADSYTDRSLYDRCITRGIAGSFLPVIYNNGNEIVQGPGWVALRNEMIHETRIVPIDSRPRLNGEVKQWMGDSRGRWEGNTLIVETTNFNDRTSGIGVNGGGRTSLHGLDGHRAHHARRARPAGLGHDLHRSEDVGPSLDHPAAAQAR